MFLGQPLPDELDGRGAELFAAVGAALRDTGRFRQIATARQRAMGRAGIEISLSAVGVSGFAPTPMPGTRVVLRRLSPDGVAEESPLAATLTQISLADRNFDGNSFAQALFDEKAEHRAFAYGVHNNIPEGPAYPIRTITNGKFRYIRNLRPDDIYIEKHLMGVRGDGALNNPYWSTWMFESGQTEEAARLVKRYMKRPAEELYRTTEDPYELVNVAGDPSYSKIKETLSRALDLWLHEQNDPGAALDTREAHSAAKRGEHIY